ncbi:MAG TPA: HAMP domain-containing sensor histidine kinase [Polyangiaceae bacterium]|jgi:signal transduction histidine kinase|nr:HAMP domain-containing sensor histidine kinase [Polyangiaceae bacterium]
MRWSFPRKLAWKLYAVALVQLVLLTGVFMGVGRLVMGPPPDDSTAANADPPPPSDRPRLGRTPPRPHPPISAATTIFLGGLLILGIGSLLTARWIVRPLERLAGAAKALGTGDLRARSGLRRRDEIGDLARTFDEMGERIERLLLAEKELMANVSHELRTPLARLRVALDIAGEAETNAGATPGQVSMGEMSADLDELETLIDDILTATRLEIARGTPAAAHFEVHPMETPCDSLCERAAARFRARHPTRPLTIATERDLPLVRVDPVLFRRVLDNLLENAHKYSPDPSSGITLRASLSTAIPGAATAAAFEVADEGMGIPEEDLPHLFTPFFRGEKSRARGTGGVGLGLTLARRIVEAHRGSIEVASTVGAGATFRVLVPAA